MATNRYALTDYILTITIDENSALPGISGTSYSIGGPGLSGQGSFIGGITLTRNEQAWSTAGDYTGSWVHNKNNNKTGTCQLDINQISDDVIRLAQICAIYESVQESVPGFSIQIKAAYKNSISGSDVVATCNDCYIQKIPDLKLANEADIQEWVFTCGQILFYQ